MVIRRISPLSCAKIFGLLHASLGLVFGALFSLFVMTAGRMLPEEASSYNALLGTAFGVSAIIALPIFYGVMGVVAGGLGAMIYNVVAGWAGGLEIEVQ